MPNDTPTDPTPAPPDAHPSPRALRRSTMIVLLVAALLVVTTVLPAEYNVDPTGIGAALGLKEIGEIKRDAMEEAADAARIDSARAADAAAQPTPPAAP